MASIIKFVCESLLNPTGDSKADLFALDVTSDTLLFPKAVPAVGAAVSFLRAKFRDEDAVKVVTPTHQVGWVARTDINRATQLAAAGRKGTVTELTPWTNGGRPAYDGNIEMD